ncbi:Mobile element protein [Escherichia coli SCD1]|nr:Mobile element protein [Escherichia coli SCD1]
MYLEGLAETPYRVLHRQLADDGVLQPDSFAKYAAVDSIGQRNSYVKTWGCGGFLNETNIYSRGKSLCF